VALAAAIVLLAAALLAQSALVVLAAPLAALALLAYLVLLARVVRSHRMPLDWTARHALAGAVAVLVLVGGGIALAWTGADTALGARLGAAYGVAALLGWMSNLVIGMSYKLFPGFVAAARTERGLRAVPVAELGTSTHVQAAVFALHNAGVSIMVTALVVDAAAPLQIGAALLATGALVYGVVTARTLALTLVDPVPANTPFRILP
jgi:hypothetical protein